MSDETHYVGDGHDHRNALPLLGYRGNPPSPRFVPLRTAQAAVGTDGTLIEVRIDPARVSGVHLEPGEVSSWEPCGAQIRFVGASIPTPSAPTTARSAMFEDSNQSQAEAEAERERVRAVLEEQVGTVGVGIDDLTDDIMAALGGE